MSSSTNILFLCFGGWITFVLSSILLYFEVYYYDTSVLLLTCVFLGWCCFSSLLTVLRLCSSSIPQPSYFGPLYYQDFYFLATCYPGERSHSTGTQQLTCCACTCLAVAEIVTLSNISIQHYYHSSLLAASSNSSSST